MTQLVGRRSDRRAPRTFSWACLVVLGLIGAARADGVGIVAITATDAPRASVISAMAGAIGGADTTPSPAGPARLVLDAVAEARSAIAAGAVPATTLGRFRRVRHLIDEGWRAFLRVQVDLAASRLAVARTEAEALVAFPGGTVLYADAALRLGAVLAHLGRTSEAEAALALALALDPDRPITLAEFSPDIVAAVDGARAQVRSTRAVRIASDPVGATIAIDGVDRGRAPLEVELALGQHVVVARAPQFESRALAFAVDRDTTEVALELARDVEWTRLAEGAAAGLAAAPAQELADATLRFADLDQLVLVAATQRRGGPALLVQRCAGLPARCTAMVDVGYAERAGLAAAAREAWHAVRSADLRYAPSVFGDGAPTGTRSDERCTLCRSPILWGGLGAVALIGTVVLIAVVSGSQPPPTVVVDPGQF